MAVQELLSKSSSDSGPIFGFHLSLSIHNIYSFTALESHYVAIVTLGKLRCMWEEIKLYVVSNGFPNHQYTFLEQSQSPLNPDSPLSLDLESNHFPRNC